MTALRGQRDVHPRMETYCALRLRCIRLAEQQLSNSVSSPIFAAVFRPCFQDRKQLTRFNPKSQISRRPVNTASYKEYARRGRRGGRVDTVTTADTADKADTINTADRADTDETADEADWELRNLHDLGQS